MEAVDDAFKTMDVDMAEEHARAQMRAQMNIGEEALIGRWSWDDIQVELLTWDEDGDFGDAWSRIPFAFWARYHQYNFLLDSFTKIHACLTSTSKPKEAFQNQNCL